MLNCTGQRPVSRHFDFTIHLITVGDFSNNSLQSSLTSMQRFLMQNAINLEILKLIFLAKELRILNNDW